MDRQDNRDEAERWLQIAIRLLNAEDFNGSKRFALRAQEKDPLYDKVDHIMAVADVLMASKKLINNHIDWYAILQLDAPSTDLELIRRQYKRLAFLCHPDKTESPFTAHAFSLVADAWGVLSDPTKKGLYDNELNLLSKFKPIVLGDSHENPIARSVTPQSSNLGDQAQKQQVRRSPREKKRKTEKGAEWQNCNSSVGKAEASRVSRLSSFWTACPYCYHLYEYPRVYVDCVLRCQNCRRGFHAAVIPSPPQAVPGKEAYLCCWAFFPIGFSKPPGEGKEDGSLPNWNPFACMFQTKSEPHGINLETDGVNLEPHGVGNEMGGESGTEKNEEMVDASDESWEIGGKQKRKKSGTPKKSPMKGRKVNGSVLQGGNVDGGVGVGGKPAMRRKTTARRPKKQTGDMADMDLNVEIKADAEDHAAVVGEGVPTESIEKEATEGIGFFEGLDDILGSLPILNAAVEPEVEEAEA